MRTHSLDESFLPLTKLFFHHKIEKVSDGYRLTHRAEITGLLSFLFYFIVGWGIKKDTKPAMEKLVQMLES